MEKKELVFVTMPAAGHMVPTLEFAKLLLQRSQQHISITILLIRLPSSLPTPTSDPNIRFIELPQVDPLPLEFSKSENKYFELYIGSHKSHLKDAIINRSIRVAGLVVDFLFTSMIDVANELCIPSYVFFPSSAAFLGFMLYLPVHYSQTRKAFSVSDPDLIIPTFTNPLPCSALPSCVYKIDDYEPLLNHALRFKDTKGIFIHTFAELEPQAIKSLQSEGVKLPPVYMVGPLLNPPKDKNISDNDEVKLMEWLNDQPSASVLLLCFGSLGGFKPPQLKEIATALESSEQRFLWSVRKPLSEDFCARTGDYNISEVLPKGFLERTKHRGFVCGWVPQAQVLAHEAVGGFVSHCGWNSFLESLWHGVPIAAWPIYAEQQTNAFQLVRELGLAVEVKIDYRLENSSELVVANEIEKAIGSLMDAQNPIRKRVKDMSEICRKVGLEGGSSFVSIGQLVEDIS